jgi:PAS domain S-box-containing protein
MSQPTPSSGPIALALSVPSVEQLLAGTLALGRDVHLEMEEGEILDRFLGTLSALFPGRALAIRACDARGSEVALVRAIGGVLREGVAAEPLTLRPAAIEKTRLKTAVAESARIRIRDRWDAPFSGLAAGFAVPLVAAGELYGVLDVGYPLGVDLADLDEPLVVPLANHLSIALRNERLHRETTLLRDYNARLIEHANALILGVDRQWRVTVCNQALCQLTGWQRQEILGSDLRDWLPLEDRPRLTKLFLAALSGRLTDTVEVELQARAGGRVRTLWSVAAISGRGQVQAVVAVGQDQTRLRDLQDQVIHAEKLATLGQLAAGVVHELNNPLTSITVYADYLLKKIASQGGRVGDALSLDVTDAEKLRRISAGAQRIMRFAKDLVQYAKPTGSEHMVVSLADVVDHSLSFCEHLFGRADVALAKEIVADVREVYAVPGQLEQVVINLVTNAVHAAPRGGTVWVRTFAVEPDRVGLSIADDGPGIAAADHERIFEPFFTTKQGGSGTGLGLSIVKNIVELHGGRIEVGTSAVGGALFTVLLPGMPAPGGGPAPPSGASFGPELSPSGKVR